MFIEKVRVGNFGKLSDKTVELKDGINVLYGKNEAGKTTLHQFVESFFQINKTGYNGEYDKYQPWNNEEVFGGDLELVIDDKKVTMIADLKRQELITEDELDGVDEQLKDLTLMNLLGVKEFDEGSSKEFIEEIQHRIVNIKNVSGTVLDYETSLNNLEAKRNALINGQTRNKSLNQITKLNEEIKDLKAKINKAKQSFSDYYVLKKMLSDNLHDKESLEGSIVLRKYKDLAMKLEKVNGLVEMIDEKQIEINNNDLYKEFDYKKVDAFINLMEEKENRELDVKEVESQKDSYVHNIESLGLEQSEKAIYFLSDNMYGVDFNYDVKSFLKADEELKMLESDSQVEEYKKAKKEEEEDQKHLQEIEHDYVSVLNLKNKRTSVVELSKDKEELIRSTTKLDMLKERVKPFSLLMVVFAILLVSSVAMMVAFPEYLIGFAVLSILMLVAFVGFVYLNFNAKKTIGQLTINVEKLKATQAKLDETIQKIDEELLTIIHKNGVSTPIEFEPFYINEKNRILIKDKVDYSVIENRINELTINRNMLKRRVEKWLRDSELTDAISVEEVGFEEKIAKHIEKCSNYSENQQLISERLETIAGLKSEIDKIVSSIKKDKKIAALLDKDMEYILNTKEKYNQLKDEKRKLIEEKETLLHGTSHDHLIKQTAKQKKKQVKSEILKKWMNR